MYVDSAILDVCVECISDDGGWSVWFRALLWVTRSRILMTNYTLLFSLADVVLCSRSPFVLVLFLVFFFYLSFCLSIWFNAVSRACSFFPFCLYTCSRLSLPFSVPNSFLISFHCFYLALVSSHTYKIGQQRESTSSLLFR